MIEKPRIGVYFSANDVVYDWAVAFLNSFRTFNPDLRLILIPFNEQCDRILKLQDNYTFEVYTDPSFKKLEAIGQAFELGHTPTGKYWFRRYASFWGPLDLFMYLDARQVVLADLKPIIQALEDYNFDFLHFDCAINQVYEPGELRRKLLKKGKARGFLSGLWISKKGLFTIEEFDSLSTKALKVRYQLNPRNTDQAFINYCCDMKPVKYGHVSEVLGGICQNAWARQPGSIYQQDGKYYLWDYGGLDHKKQVILIHWAGYKLTDFVPYKLLLLSFRFKSNIFLDKLYIYVISFLLDIPKIVIKFLIAQKDINLFYHSRKYTLSTTLNNMNLNYFPVNIRHYLKYKLGIDSAYTQTSKSEQECLRKYATVKKLIAEIGVFEGVNTTAFRSVMDREGVIIAIDPYPRSFLGLLGFGWIRRIAHEEVGKIRRGQVIWIETLGKFASSDQRVKPHLPIDFLFIDGDHSYEGIKGDWEAWTNHIKSGGIVALHDSVNCQGVGSEIFAQEVILKDPNFSFIESVDTLTILIKK
ncbi:MAG: class I SAM-dependent methyltransferase [Moorea sp. SIO3G5]|nr:class I SAM-dependent methyltransferase [Moorena sp. SIO3G5]